MKATITSISLGLILTLGSCHFHNDGPIGPQGPSGPQGPQGEPGESGYVFEWEGVNFTAPDYQTILSYPNNFTPLASDVALVYMLWDIQDGLEVWRPIPQTILTVDGLLQYNYDYTQFDVRLFLDAEFPLDWLTAADTDAWVVRVVVVPGDFWNTGGRLDTDYYAIAEALGLPDIQKERKVLARR